MIVAKALTLAIVGELLGLTVSIAASRQISQILFDTSSIDPWTYTTVTFLLLLVVLAAGYIPARRAANTNPVEVLRG